MEKKVNRKSFLLTYCIIHSIIAMHLLLAQSEAKRPEIKIAQKDEVVFGQSARLSGPLELYGSIIQGAINSRFKEINDDGGIHGKKIRLISLDDEGDPLKAVDNINVLKKHGVSMFFGNTHTRGILKVLPLIENKEIAVFFPWGGDQHLRNPQLTHLINGPGFLEPQLNFLVEHIVYNVQHRKIAIFYADDNFSQQAADYLTEKLKTNNLEPISVNSFNRFTLDIVKQADQIIATDPKIVICISTSMPSVRLINRFFEKGHYATLFFGIDSTFFVGEILKNKGAYFTYTSPVPNPFSDSLPIAQQYRQALRKYHPEQSINILSFTYYLAASILVDAMKKVQGDISKEKIITQIESMTNYDLGGFTIQFDPTTRHAFGKTISLIKG
jgi:branched-chain amino acid transport system substrate-binding protein